MVERLGRARKDERGFTLIELLVVVVILGIVAVVLIPRVLGRTDEARDNAAKSDVRAMKSVLETYYSDNGALPDASNIGAVMQANGVKWGTDGVKDPWGKKGYGYQKISDTSYKIASKGKDGTANTDDDIYAADDVSPTKGKCGFTSATSVSDNSTW